MLAESFADVLAINWERASVLGFPGGSDGKGSACNVGDLVRSLGREDPLQNGMATHPCILAWRIPWTEETDGILSMGSQRVKHN